VPEPRASEARNAFYRAYLAERLEGNVAAARATYATVVGDDGAGPNWIARSALRLSAIEAALGERGAANDLIGQALALAGDDSEVLVRADRLRARTASSGSPRRGPPPGTALDGAGSEAVKRFAAAEKQMQLYYRRPLAPRIEGLSSSLRSNRAALEAVVRSYRGAAEGDALAEVAAQFRIGALYHDSALAMFSVPPELEPRAAARLRSDLRRRARAYLDKAVVAYRRSLDSAAALEAGRAVFARRWRVPAAAGLASVEGLGRRRQ